MSNITYTQVPGEQVGNLIDAIRPSLAHQDENTVAMACITIAVLCYNPSIALKDLILAVKEVSEHISLLTMPTDTSQKPS